MKILFRSKILHIGLKIFGISYIIAICVVITFAHQSAFKHNLNISKKYVFYEHINLLRM